MKKLVISAIVFVSGFSGWAQRAENQLTDTIKIEEVVVTGTPVKVHRNNVPLAISVVSREQIAESTESALLPLLSGQVPGLFVTERGITGFGVATGSAGQITIRGIGGNPTTGVLMLIDGHPQFMGIMGHPLPDSYIASDVERVEVIRGPGSTLYGSNAMGGVINIITRQQNQNGINGNAKMMYGSYNTQKYSGSAGYRNNGFSLFGSVNHDRTDGHRDNSDFKITNGYLKTGYQFNEHLSASADISLANFKTTDPGPDTLNAIPGSGLDILRGYWSLTVDNAFEKTSGSLKLFHNFGEHDVTDGFHSTDNNYGVNFFQAFHFLKGNSLTLGIDHIRYGGMAENTKAMNGQGMVFADTTVYETGIYGFVQQTLAKKLTLTAGLRLQDHKIYGNEWIPSGGFALKIDSKTSWKGNISKGFRSPTIRELFMWNHNPNLQPEKIMNYETGIYRSFFNSKINVELTGFYVKGDNLIVTGEMGNLFNSGEIENQGIELAITGRAAQNLDYNLSYSYIDMKNPIVSTPKHNLYLGASYHWKKCKLNASLRQIADMDNDVGPVVNLESYTVVDAKFSWKVSRFAEWFVSGENLLDQQYAINRYYPMPGTTVFSGINLNF
ncbi:MAG: TonB-dependent receptor [Mangrovibacterium sp.]